MQFFSSAIDTLQPLIVGLKVGGMGQNYLEFLIAIGFQGLLILL